MQCYRFLGYKDWVNHEERIKDNSPCLVILRGKVGNTRDPLAAYVGHYILLSM